MGLSLIVGPPNSGRAGAVRRRLLASLDREPVLVVPTGDDAAWFERELCAGGEATLGISIRTFGWLFEDVASALAVDAGPLLTGPQRLALIRAAISTTDLGRLRHSAQRPGFAPALDTLIEELQAALVSPAELADRAAELDDGAHEAELASLYAAYTELRERPGRSDRGALAEAALTALRARPEGWGSRPVFLYGFDDLTLAQRELVAGLAETAEVTVALNYADRRSLAARATLVGELTVELGATIEARLEPEGEHTPHRSLRHLDRNLFEPDPGTVPVDDGVVLMECAGERGEAEAIGIEVARLLADGADPSDIAIVVRHPSSGGGVLAAILAGYGIPVALEARAPVDRTAVGRALVSLCRAAAPGGQAEDLLAHLRADPTVPAGATDGVEERIRRGEAETAEQAVEHWKRAPRHLARLQAAGDGAARMHALAAIAREVAEGAHTEQAPLAASGTSGGAADLLHPIELRAAVAAAELLEELATLGELPGCPAPTLGDAVEALEGASVRTWRGPTDGRVRILSPYRLRAGRAHHLFVTALQDGEFPAASPPDPLLGDDRRARLGIPALVRREQADEERYLFGACVSRPTQRLYLSWRSCDDEGAALARSPFVDEVLDLLGDGPEEAERELKRSRGLERVVADPAEAPSERELARSLAAHANGDPAATMAAIGVAGPTAERVLAELAAVPSGDELPGPLRVPKVIETLRERTVLSAGQLEHWLSCPYRWFVDHELAPVRLEPESDPLWLGGLVHAALADLYKESPGDDSIPRPGDVGRWKRRFGELLAEATKEARLGPERVAALARAREQVERFLEDESASETALRPRPDLIERGFGMDDPDDPGGLVLAVLADLYKEAPGDDSIPRPGDVGRWKRRFGELLDEGTKEARLGPERVATLARAREQVERFLEDESESETTLRPRPELIERGFGMDDPDDPGGLDLGDFTLRGRIDRIDLAPDGRSAVVRDYKTGRSVADAARFDDEGSLQIQLYMRVAQRILELDLIGGLYQPLGATGAKGRRPRGLVRAGDERLAGLDLVRGGDHCDDETFEGHLVRAEGLAVEKGGELRAGDIDRRPLNGTCPKYCTFQPICRLERALGLPSEENGERSE